MHNWILWLSVAFVLLILELMTGTFYLLIASIATASAAVAAYYGAGWIVQLILAAAVAVIGVFILRSIQYGQTQHQEAQKDPNINLDIGQLIHVGKWNPDRTARVAYRGSTWDVELAADEKMATGKFQIVALRGSHLIVRAAKENSLED